MVPSNADHTDIAPRHRKMRYILHNCLVEELGISWLSCACNDGVIMTLVAMVTPPEPRGKVANLMERV